MRLVLMLLLAAACSKDGGDDRGSNAPQPAAGKPRDEKAELAAIQKARAALLENFSAGDVKRTAAAYTSDAVLVQNFHEVISGQPALVEFLQAQFDTAVTEMAASTDEITFTASDRAVERGTYKSTITMKADGSSREDRGRFVAIWQRQPDGSWKAAVDIDDSASPP